MNDEVLIVGAGPTGLTLALSLSRQQIPVRIIDAAKGPSEHSKALGMHARTLEQLHLCDLAEAFVEAGLEIQALNLFSESKRIGRVDLSRIRSVYPFVLSIPQSESERLLSEALAERGVEVEWSTALTGLTCEDGPNGAVTAVVEGPDGGVQTAVYPWVVGCDGARSTVRRELDLDFEGETVSQWLGLADITLRWEKPHDEIAAFLASDGLLGLIPLPGEDRYRLVATLPAIDADTPPDLSIADFKERFEQRAGGPGTIVSASWISAFRVRECIVPEYRQGRVFLAGDAAHIHSPVGAQGMNTGMQDAWNLAWKLALVCRGQAPEGLLDSYHAERHPVAASVIRGTGAPTRLGTAEHPILKKIRDLAANLVIGIDAVQRRVLTQLSMLAVSYPDSPIVGQWRRGPLGSQRPSVGEWFDFGAAPKPGERAPDILVEPEARLLDLFSDSHHTLLIFDGRAQTEHGYRRLEKGVTELAHTWGEMIQSHLIVSPEQRPAGLSPEAAVWHDVDLVAHHVYGAGAECLYLVRPDGYVAWRSQPADFERLGKYLEKVFGRSS